MRQFNFLTPVFSGRAYRAAARGDHVRALASNAVPPIAVQSQLGLHHAVLKRAAVRTSRDRFYTALAQAELGTTDRAVDTIGADVKALAGRDKLRLALAVGRWHPQAASAWMSDASHLARSALALRSQAHKTAQHFLDLSTDTSSANACILRSAVASTRGDHRLARRAANDAFTRSGLAPPLSEDSAEPIRLASLHCRPDARVNGPLISVIMPARNATATIAMAIASVLGQSWEDIDLVVVDDASTDDTAAVAEQAIGCDPRARVVRSGVCGGPYVARNIGLAHARGTFITFNDADDWSHPERLARGVAPLLADPALLATQSRLVRLADTGAFVAPRVFPMIRANPSSLLMRAHPVVTELGGFDEVAFGADEEFTARIIARFGASSIARSPALMCIASHAASSLTRSPTIGVESVAGQARRVAYREQWHERHLEIFRKLDKGLHRRLWDAGPPAGTWKITPRAPSTQLT